MLDCLNWRSPATESSSQLAQRFQAGLLAQRERADSQIFWLLIAQWAVIMSTSIAMATRWQHARLDTLSAAVIWVGVLSVLPLAMVLRSPGSRWSRWTVVVSQGVMCEANRGQRHRLLVLATPGRQRILYGFQSFGQTGDVAMAKNGKNARK